MLKEGDHAYFLRDLSGVYHIKEGTVTEIYYINQKSFAHVGGVGQGPIGEKVFKTFEEAEAKQIELQERINEIRKKYK